MALNSLIARVQQASRRLMDVADWTHGGVTAALPGCFDARFDSPLDGRARPIQPAYVILSADAPGIALGDTLALAGVTYSITGVLPDHLGNTTLELRIAR